MSHTAEIIRQLWENDAGYHLEVGPDADGLSLIELRYYEPGEKTPHSRVTMTAVEARYIAQFLTAAANEAAAQ